MFIAFIVVSDAVSVGDTIFSVAVVVVIACSDVIFIAILRDHLMIFQWFFSINFVHFVRLVIFPIVYCARAIHRLSTSYVVLVILYVVVPSFCHCKHGSRFDDFVTGRVPGTTDLNLLP